MGTATDYELRDYGIEHSQYFQGHGASLSKWQHACVGVGSSYAEAVADALDQAAGMGYDIELEEVISDDGRQTAETVHAAYCTAEDHSDCDSDLHYYVGLRWI